jgi:hypothetical protein
MEVSRTLELVGFLRVQANIEEGSVEHGKSYVFVFYG